MSTRRLLLIAACVAVAASSIRAQSADPAPTPRPTPPPGPLLSDAPDFAAWRIVRQNVPGMSGSTVQVVLRNSALPKPESVATVTKTGQVRRRLMKVKTGEQEDVWYEHGNRITLESMWKMPLFESGVSQPKMPQGPDFPELAWVAAKNYVGQEEYLGAVYSVFETKLAARNAAQALQYGIKPTETFNRAFINADTRLPFLLQTEDALQRYVFQGPPTAMLEVPPVFQTLFDTYEKARAEPVRKPVSP